MLENNVCYRPGDKLSRYSNIQPIAGKTVKKLTILADDVYVIKKISDTEEFNKLELVINCDNVFELNQDNSFTIEKELKKDDCVSLRLTTDTFDCQTTYTSHMFKYAKIQKINEDLHVIRFEEIRQRSSDEQIWDDVVISIEKKQNLDPQPEIDQDQVTTPENPTQPEPTPPVIEPTEPAQPEPVPTPDLEPTQPQPELPINDIEVKEGFYEIRKVFSDAMVTGSLSIIYEDGTEKEICQDYLALKDDEVIDTISFDKIQHITLVIYPKPTAQQLESNKHLAELKTRILSTDTDSVQVTKLNETDSELGLEDSVQKESRFNVRDFNDLVIQFVKVEK